MTMRPSHKAAAALLFLLPVLPLQATAAEVTRIASSFEEDDPFGMFLEVGFDRDQRRLLLSREEQVGGEVRSVPELRYVEWDSRLNIDLRFGIWQDVELSYKIPIVFQRDEVWGLALGTSPATSSVVNSCLRADGTLRDPTCPMTGAGAQPLFGSDHDGPLTDDPLETFRGGIGDMQFGIAYAPFNQEKDPTKPTWLVGLDYRAPTAALLNPSEPTAPNARGGIGDRTHRYTLYTALSRKLGAFIEPYFKLSWVLPYKGPGWYSNCDDPNPETMARPEGCGTENWDRWSTGIEVPMRLALMFGSEFELYNDEKKDQQIVLDVRLLGEHVSDGRYYNELSGLTGKLEETEDFLEFGGHIGLAAYASDYVRIRGKLSLLHQTDHYVSGVGPLGVDTNEDGSIALDSDELDPTADLRIDLPSRRFRASEAWVFRFGLEVMFAF